MIHWLSFILILISVPAMAEKECKPNAIMRMEEFAADIRLDLEIEESCSGVKKEYVKKLFKTKSALEAEMNFLSQSFCFRKKNGEIAGCNLKKSQRLASVSKVFSMDYLHSTFGDTEIGVNATLSEQGDLCLVNDGLANITRSEMSKLKAKIKGEIKHVCVSDQFTYGGNDECSKEYTNVMHSQSWGVIEDLKACSDKALGAAFGFSKITRGNCQCNGPTEKFTVKLKERTQGIMAASDSWQIFMLYNKLGDKATAGLQEYLRKQNENMAELNLLDPVGNAPENRATCESVLNAPAIKSCNTPPLACADQEGATFNRFTKYVDGQTEMKNGSSEAHEAYYEKLDNHLCGKTGSIASEGLKNFVGCFKDSRKRPIQSFAIFLDGKDTTFLREMKPHTEVLEDFYQQLLDPETQKELINQ